MTASFKPLNQEPVRKHALVPPPPRRPDQPVTMRAAGPSHEPAASGQFPRQPEIPVIESRQRISEEFYQSPPAYSAPPPAPSFAPPPPVRRGTRARRQRAKLLFLAVFIPAVLLLLVGLAF